MDGDESSAAGAPRSGQRPRTRAHTATTRIETVVKCPCRLRGVPTVTQGAHEGAQVEPADVDAQPFQDIRVPPQMRAAHPTGVVELRVRAFQSLSPAPLQGTPKRASNPSAIGVHRVARRRLRRPAAPAGHDTLVRSLEGRNTLARVRLPVSPPLPLHEECFRCASIVQGGVRLSAGRRAGPHARGSTGTSCAAVRLSCASVGRPRVRVAGRRAIVVR